MFSLPYSQKKSYMTGIDWMVSGLDHMTRKAQGHGNHSQILIELDSVLDEGVFVSAVRNFCRKHSILYGRIKRDCNLAPYWSYSDKNTDDTRVDIDVQEIPQERIYGNACINASEPFKNRRCYLSFLLLRGETYSSVAVKFDHKLFDARGIELFLCGLNRDSVFVHNACPAGLDHWKEKFLSGQKTNRFFRSLPSKKSTSLFGSEAKGVLRYRHFTLNASDVIKNADSEAGYLMTSPYLLAKIYDAVRELIENDYKNIVISVSADRRGPACTDPFFNKLSFMYFALSPGLTQEQVINVLREQLIFQVREKIPEHIANASMLMRIVPCCSVADVLKHMPISFSYSYMSNTAYSDKSFLGVKIRNILHMPVVPSNPGVGVFFTTFADKLNAVFTYYDKMFEQNKVDRFIDKLHRGVSGVQ